jgi:hypothetical protein
VDDAISTTSGNTGRQAGVRIRLIAVITLFDTLLNHAVATTRRRTIISTFITVVLIAIVTKFVFSVYDAITTARPKTIIQTRIGLHSIAIITLFITLYLTISALSDDGKIWTHRIRFRGGRRLAPASDADGHQK